VTLAGPDASPPLLRGRHVGLRPLTPADYPLVQACELQDAVVPSWRFRGRTPGPEQWSRILWADVLAQYLIVPASQRTGPIGLVLAYNANFQDQHAYLAALRFDAAARSPLMILGVGLFVRYVFTCWQFRKLYLDTPEYNYDALASGGEQLFEVEARLREHVYFGGRHWDQLTLAIYRDNWSELEQRLLAIEAPTPEVTVHLPTG
jgi:RimJ/RimL family protein N-acetyltransferase